jgi:hypothetical protein
VTCPDTLDVGARGFGLFSYTPVNGSQLSSLEGPVEISFDVLKIEPREDGDFVVAGGTTGVDHPVWHLALASTGTNPFAFGHGTMRFAVTMPNPGAPTLALYDIRGRLVNTLLSGRQLAAGPNSVEWRGTDNAGHRVSSGIYFAQLRLGNQVALAKVVVAN